MKLKRVIVISTKSNVKKTKPIKANLTQSKPISIKAKNEHNYCYNKELRRNSAAQSPKSKPKAKPIQTQIHTACRQSNPV